MVLNQPLSDNRGSNAVGGWHCVRRTTGMMNTGARPQIRPPATRVCSLTGAGQQPHYIIGPADRGIGTCKDEMRSGRSAGCLRSLAARRSCPGWLADELKHGSSACSGGGWPAGCR